MLPLAEDYPSAPFFFVTPLLAHRCAAGGPRGGVRRGGRARGGDRRRRGARARAAARLQPALRPGARRAAGAARPVHAAAAAGVAQRRPRVAAARCAPTSWRGSSGVSREHLSPQLRQRHGAHAQAGDRPRAPARGGRAAPRIPATTCATWPRVLGFASASHLSGTTPAAGRRQGEQPEPAAHGRPAGPVRACGERQADRGCLALTSASCDIFHKLYPNRVAPLRRDRLRHGPLSPFPTPVSLSAQSHGFPDRAPSR